MSPQLSPNSRFDHLFFTGSTAVGKVVARAAADNLTPVTLELGGKSPVIVDANYSIQRAAATVAWAKLYNGGQVCISPDYVLVPRGREGVRHRRARQLASSIRRLLEIPSTQRFSTNGTTTASAVTSRTPRHSVWR